MNRFITGRSARVALSGVVLACGQAAAAPPKYDVVSIGDPSFLASGATSISANGWTAGWGVTALGPAIWRRSPDGQVQVLASGINGDVTNVQGDAGLNIFVNSSGAVAASWRVGTGRVGAVFPPSGTLAAITGLSDVDVAGLNDAGRVIASGDLGVGNRVGVAGPPAQLVTIPAFAPNAGSRGVQLTGINAAGVVVGGSTDVTIPLRPLRLTSSGLTTLPIPAGGLAGIAEGVSDDGRIVGRVLAPSPQPVADWRAVVWTNNIPAVVGSIAWTPPVGYYTIPVVKPYKINSQARAVGTVRYVRPIPFDPNGAPDYADVSQARGFLIDAGRMYDLSGLLTTGSSVWRIVAATDIANDGRIVASARFNGVGPERAVLLNPVLPPGQPPLPTTPPAAPPAPGLHHSTDLGVSPADGITSSRRLRLFGTAEPRAQVRFLIDGVETRHRAFANAGGEYRVDVLGLSEGEHRFAVYAINIVGASQASPETTLTLDFTRPNTPPAPTMVAADQIVSPLPAYPATRNQQPSFEGRATPGHQVQLRQGSRVIATASVATDGTYTLRPTVLLRAGGVHTLRVYEMDVAGNLSRLPALVRFLIVR